MVEVVVGPTELKPCPICPVKPLNKFTMHRFMFSSMVDCCLHCGYIHLCCLSSGKRDSFCLRIVDQSVRIFHSIGMAGGYAVQSCSSDLDSSVEHAHTLTRLPC